MQMDIENRKCKQQYKEKAKQMEELKELNKYFTPSINDRKSSKKSQRNISSKCSVRKEENNTDQNIS